MWKTDDEPAYWHNVFIISGEERRGGVLCEGVDGAVIMELSKKIQVKSLCVNSPPTPHNTLIQSHPLHSLLHTAARARFCKNTCATTAAAAAATCLAYLPACLPVHTCVWWFDWIRSSVVGKVNKEKRLWVGTILCFFIMITTPSPPYHRRAPPITSLSQNDTNNMCLCVSFFLVKKNLPVFRMASKSLLLLLLLLEVALSSTEKFSSIEF